MNDDINAGKMDSLSSIPKKRGRKSIKDKTAPVATIGAPEMDHTLNTDKEAMEKAIANIIQNSVDKFGKIANNQLKDTRTDFDCLQPIVSEFLEDFIIIGHTLEGQRVVMRYTSSPADMDKLTELCKKVLVRMMIQEQSGS
jgi:hypothetical protein